ncbi:MAG TPA: zinc ribbon domain-containing protein [Solirubrobacteraceae bacterium]|nr:zinc ribbon domain-containing protein [Solirubrobacteraceae bacterium]
MSFDAARWSRGDLVTGVATLVLLIALFLPWFSVQFVGFAIPGLSVDALSAHGWMYITLLVTLAVIGYLVARAVYDDLHLPVPRWQALAGATGVTLLLSFVAFVDAPTGLGQSYGAFIGLVSAIAAVVGTVLVRSEERGAVVAPVEEEATVKCSGCGRASPAGNRFCRSCGSKLMSGLSTPSR